MAISMNFNEALDSTKIDNISFINWLSSQKVIPNINVPRYCASCENLIKIEYNDNHSDGAIYRCTSRNCRNIMSIRCSHTRWYFLNAFFQKVDAPFNLF